MKRAMFALVVALVATIVFSKSRWTAAMAQDETGKIELYDNCDPADPAWETVGGCAVSREKGNVTLAEFNMYLTSPLAVMQLVGHPSWRIEPSYLTMPTAFVDVANVGGRLHTFTEVQNFGGGRLPPLNQGQSIAPECNLDPAAADPTALIPRQSRRVSLGNGTHKFQCCIHPWMRSVVRVGPDNNGPTPRGR